MPQKEAQHADVFAAVRASDHKFLREYLECGGDANAVDEYGNSLLCIAAEIGDTNSGEMLIDYGASPNRATYAWPIHFAAGKGHLHFIELLLQHESEVHCLDEDGGTPLSDAAASGHVEVIKRLLEAGADPTYRDRYGKRAILYAAEKGRKEVVGLLASYAAPQELRQAQLKLKFADTKRPSEEFTQFKIAALRGELDKVRKYIEKGGDPNDIAIDGSTALASAARLGQLEVVKYLLNHGADPNMVDEDGSTALDWAAYQPKPLAYELLYPLTDPKLRRAAERAKAKKVKAGLWK